MVDLEYRNDFRYTQMLLERAQASVSSLASQSGGGLKISMIKLRAEIAKVRKACKAIEETF